MTAFIFFIEIEIRIFTQQNFPFIFVWSFSYGVTEKDRVDKYKATLFSIGKKCMDDLVPVAFR